MRIALIACVILIAIFFVAVAANHRNETDDGSQSCRSKIQRTCKSSTKSCGRLGRANLCTSFGNDCQRQLSNCGSSSISSKFYRKVRFNLCKGLPKDTPRPCGSGSKSNKTNSTKRDLDRELI